MKAFVDEVNDIESKFRMGDSNAHVGTDTWQCVIGKHGGTALNDNERYLLEFCCSDGHGIMNIFFQHKEACWYTWNRPITRKGHSRPLKGAKAQKKT